MFIGNVRVIVENGALSAHEAEYYIHNIQKYSKKHILKRVTFIVTPDHLDLRYAFDGIPFERIRRISSQERYELQANVS
jgi:hypothetical protein